MLIFKRNKANHIFQPYLKVCITPLYLFNFKNPVQLDFIQQ